MTEVRSSRGLIHMWQVLRTGRRYAERIAVMPLDKPAVPSEVWASVSSSGLPQLLLALDDNTADYSRDEGKITVSVISLHYKGSRLKVLSVQCGLAQLERAFADFCISALERLAAGDSPVNAVDGVLDDLRELLAGDAGRQQGPRGTALGMAGELLVLRELVRDNPDLIDAWLGPEGTRHDFRWGDVAMEVKTHLHRPVRQVSISSLDQLEPPSGGHLYLIEVCLERNAAGDVTLSQLVDDIARCLPPDARSKFMHRMAEYEFADKESADRWSLQYMNSFIVGRGFPSLTKMHLTDRSTAPGVSHVTYRLDLSVADRWAYGGSLPRALVPDLRS